MGACTEPVRTGIGTVCVEYGRPKWLITMFTHKHTHTWYRRMFYFIFGTLCSYDPLWRGFFFLRKPRKKRLALLARLIIMFKVNNSSQQGLLLSCCFFDHVSSNINKLRLLLCYLRVPFHQLATPPDFTSHTSRRTLIIHICVCGWYDWIYALHIVIWQME